MSFSFSLKAENFNDQFMRRPIYISARIKVSLLSSARAQFLARCETIRAIYENEIGFFAI
jgi:hypothetical protein